LSDDSPHLSSRLSIVSSLLVGLGLLVAPWSTLWESNWVLQPCPLLRTVLLSGFLRGAVSGLGLVNVLVALADLHTRLVDPPRSD
jgi:hypothetical protein